MFILIEKRNYSLLVTQLFTLIPQTRVIETQTLIDIELCPVW